MEIIEEKYQVIYDPDAATITFKGAMMLNGAKGYEPISKLLNTVAEQRKNNDLMINLQQLKFLNSSGINTLTKFVIFINDIQKLDIKLTFLGNNKIDWHVKLGKNLTRLSPNINVIFE